MIFISRDGASFDVEKYDWDAGVGVFKATLWGIQPNWVVNAIQEGPVTIKVDGHEFVGFRALVIHMVGHSMFFEGTYEV